MEFLASLTLAEWISAITGLVTAATFVTSLTPTNADNRALNIVLAILNGVAGNVLKNKNADHKAAPSRKNYPVYVILIAGLLLSGCAAMGDLKPQNSREALVEAELVAIALAEQLISARDQGFIKRGSATDARVKSLLDDLDDALDMAHVALGGPEPETFTDYLASANAVIMGLRQILTERTNDATSNRSQPNALGIGVTWRHGAHRGSANLAYRA